MEKNPYAHSDDTADAEKAGEPSTEKKRSVRVPLAAAQPAEHGLGAIIAERRREADERRRLQEEQDKSDDEDDDSEHEVGSTQKPKKAASPESAKSEADSIDNEAAKALVGLTLAEMANESIDPDLEASEGELEDDVAEDAAETELPEEQGTDLEDEQPAGVEAPTESTSEESLQQEDTSEEEDEPERPPVQTKSQPSVSSAHTGPQSQIPVSPPHSPNSAAPPSGPPNKPGPNNPFYWQVPNPNTVPQAPNVVPMSLSPNMVVSPHAPEHGHEHRHPKLALAFGAGLIVEHLLGKRADKKISEEMRKRTNNLRSIIEGQQRQQKSMESVLEVSRGQKQPEIAALPGRMDSVPNQLYAPVFIERPATQNAEAPKLMPAVEGAPRPQETEIAQLVPDTDKLAEAQVKPQVVLERVAQAAEMDVPVEIAYERRHEVRDEPGGAGQSGGGGAPSLPVLLPTSQYQPQAATARQLAETQAYLESQRQQEQTPPYKAAAATGFAAAVIILFMSLIAYITLR